MSGVDHVNSVEVSILHEFLQGVNGTNRGQVSESSIFQAGFFRTCVMESIWL
jgi:hypothetical protein